MTIKSFLSSVAIALLAIPANAISPLDLPRAYLFFAPDSAELSDLMRDKLVRALTTARDRMSRCEQVNITVSGHLDGAELKQGRAGTLDKLRATNVRDAIRELDRVEFQVVDVVTTTDTDKRLLLRVLDDVPTLRRVEIIWWCQRR